MEQKKRPGLVLARTICLFAILGLLAGTLATVFASEITKPEIADSSQAADTFQEDSVENTKGPAHQELYRSMIQNTVGFNEVHSIALAHLMDAHHMALAYAFDRENEKGAGDGDSAVTRITMILDTSGSMDLDLDGKDTLVKENRRISMLIETVKNFLSGLADEENIEVLIVPFNNFADKTGEYSFLSLNDQYLDLLYEIYTLETGGGTNTGDGMRRAHYAMLNAPRPEGARVKDYVILLTDGEANHATLKQYVLNPDDPLDPTGTFMTEDGDPDFMGTVPRFLYRLSNETIEGLPVHKILALNDYSDQEKADQFILAGGSRLDAIYPEAFQYMDVIGEMIAAPELEREFFVVGFSNSISDYGLNRLSESVGITEEVGEDGIQRKFRANSKEELVNVFTVIKNNITKSRSDGVQGE